MFSVFQFTSILLVDSIQFYIIKLLYSASSTLFVYNYAISRFTSNFFNNFILFAELYSYIFPQAILLFNYSTLLVQLSLIKCNYFLLLRSVIFSLHSKNYVYYSVSFNYAIHFHFEFYVPIAYLSHVRLNLFHSATPFLFIQRYTSTG